MRSAWRDVGTKALSDDRKISFAEFAAKIAAEEEEVFRWRDLDRFDYDPPKERVALVSWCDEFVDKHGEVHAGFWRIIMAGDSRRWDELHDWGVLNFGEPPWRRSQVVSCVGRLGSLELFVKAMAGPSPDFVYSFKFDAPVARVVDGGRRVGPAAAAERFARPVVDERARERARWRRARRPDKAQGELF